MKTVYRHIFTGLIISVLTACSFLDENPQSFVSGAEYYKTAAQCRSVVNSTYSQLRMVFNHTFWIIQEGTSDIIYHPSDANANAIMNLSPVRSSISENIWERSYKMIMFSNSAIEGIKTSPIDTLTRNQLIGEAKIMRAFWYYHLTSSFGDVPFYLEEVKDKETLERIADLPRMSAVDTRKVLINDLREELTYDQAGEYTGALPEMKSSDIEHGRAGWAMGEMLIAKMALWNAAYDKTSGTDWHAIALDALKHLESVYGTLESSVYKLEDLYFRTKNSEEVIFEIQHSYESGGLNYTSELASICSPNYKDGKFDGVEIKELGTKANIGTCSRPTIYFCNDLQSRSGDDLRAKVNMAWDYDGKQFSSVSTHPWMGPKFWCPGMDEKRDHNNYPIFRYADAVLMMAECYLAKEDKANFEKYLNMVRSRAGITVPYEVMDWAEAQEELYEERARELFGEFQRKYDLVRWGIWYDRVIAHSDFTELKETVKPCHEFLPIPDMQVVYSDYALDNEAYKEYGL